MENQFLKMATSKSEQKREEAIKEKREQGLW
jgi:hypothetical protein